MRQATIAFISFVFGCCALALTAEAQICTATVSLAFGTVDMTSGTAIDGQGTVNVSCTGLPGATVRACPGIGTTRQMLRTGGGTINFELYSAGPGQSVWGTVGGSTAPPPIDMTLNISGSGAASMPIYGTILGSQTTVPTTNAASAYVGTPTVIVAAGSAIGNPSCATIGGANATAGVATITATYLPVCNITANPLAFGNITSTLSATDAQTSIDTKCSADTPYTMALNGGLTNAINPTQRKMRKGSDELTYGIYRDATRLLAWGASVGADVLSGAGTGGIASVPVYGRIPSQSIPPAGNYSDTVIVTIEY